MSKTIITTISGMMMCGLCAAKAPTPQLEQEQALERLTVVGSPEYQRALTQIMPERTLLDAERGTTTSLADMLSLSPWVSLNGQGGLFQTVNIRGFARWRIQTRVDGIPIHSERRAGGSAEFVPPSLVRQAYLVPGAASTQLGSGAIGGGIDVQLIQPTDTRFQGDISSQQDYRSAQVQGSLSAKGVEIGAAVNHRRGNTSKDGDGTRILDGFEQQAALVKAAFDRGWVKDASVLVSSANNIDKASADDPTSRVTQYPKNDHVLAKLTLDWHNLSIYFHDTQFDTRVMRPLRRINTLQNTSLDVGFQTHGFTLLDDWQFSWRGGLDGRTGVKATEQEVTSNLAQVFERENLRAEQWESFVAGDVSRDLAFGSLTFGARGAYLTQRDRNKEMPRNSHNEFNHSEFVGLKVPLNEHWSMSGYVSSAYRVPSLTERYFNGSTPRGEVLGDVNLNTEQALNRQFAIGYITDQTSFSLNLFHQTIDDYIERVTLSDELRQYQNLSRASIKGMDYSIVHQLSSEAVNWQLSVAGQWLDGEDDVGNPIADITPAEHKLGVRVHGSDWDAYWHLIYRQASHDQLDGELPTPGHTVMHLGGQYQWSEQLLVSARVSNVTNKRYVTSRDDLAPFAQGRNLSVSLNYQW